MTKLTYKKPKRMFEDSGIVDPEVAYHVALENVVNSRKQDIAAMIELGRYFSIFAPRQSGKTTFFEHFCYKLSEDKTYIPILLSFQDYKQIDKDAFYSLIQDAFEEQLQQRLEEINCENIEDVSNLLSDYQINNHIAFRKLFEKLNKVIPSQRIIIFIDEFDGIPIDELENFLSTIRELYQKYKKQIHKALHSIGLVGIRNIPKLVVGGVSPINIADQVKLPAFSLKNVKDLFTQYTEETNQPFTQEAIESIYNETAGQPWLVNRLGTVLTVDIKPQTIEPIDAEDVEKAIRRLIKERNSHFDNLFAKAILYKETFVQIVFNGVAYNPDDEDQTWLEQYGLIKEKNEKAIVSNLIYKRRFLNTFFSDSGATTDISMKSYYAMDGYLNIENILIDFDEYIAQIGATAFYKNQKPYEKTGQFLLTAWLYQFVKDGKGELRYETPSGLGRMDILLVYKSRKYIIETKINRSNIKKTLERAIDQISEKYMLTENTNEGYIVIFDLNTKAEESCEVKKHRRKKKEIVSFTIGIGRP